MFKQDHSNDSEATQVLEHHIKSSSSVQVHELPQSHCNDKLVIGKAHSFLDYIYHILFMVTYIYIYIYV